MASGPPNQQAGASDLRRPSFQPRYSSSQASTGITARLGSDRLADSTFELNDPMANEQSGVSSPPQTALPSAPQQQDGRKCWICQMDETEDTEENTIWRSPCPCSLVAHDDCLLEWVADGEAPKDGGAASTQNFFCPVCKAEIHIERPHDPLVGLFDRVQALAKSLAYPTALSALLGCGYAGLFAYGVNTLYLVFGREEAVAILATMRMKETVRETVGETVGAFIANTDPFFPRIDLIGWKGFLALPMIAPSLVLLRSTLGSYVLPIMTSGVSYLFQMPLFVNTNPLHKYFVYSPAHRDIYHWPPPPGLAFATLPYVFAAYNNVYRHTFAQLETKWDQAVQRKPREGETAEQIAQQRVREEEDNIFGIEIVEEEIHRDEGGNVIPAEDVLPQADGAADGLQDGQPRNNEDIFFQRNWSMSRIIMNVTGALSFPLISSIMGTLLAHGPFGYKLKGSGILQKKWGRTLVGGCLFVVLKDALTLYCKWKKAENFGKRKILDYKRSRGRA
jgi:hypothetical protein